MQHTASNRITWSEALERQSPLLLPVAHDALTARLIALAGFTAYQIGGFALSAVLHATPDIDLEHFGEKSEAAERIIGASALPVLVDADDGYGDAKNVTRTVRDYEKMGASALFIEDQIAPKRCGHMAGKRVVPVSAMEGKIHAAIAARCSSDFFVLARTDAIEPDGVRSAIKRGEKYLAAGADGIYVEGPRSLDELKAIGKAFNGQKLATSILECGGETPWVDPGDMAEMGYRMILYPSSLLFRLTRCLERGLADLRAGLPLSNADSVDMNRFEQIVGMTYWSEIESRFGGRED